VLQYYYPGATGANPSTSDIDTTELYGSVGYMGFSLGLAYSATDYFGVANSDGTTYVSLQYDYELSNGLALYAKYATTSYEGAGNSGLDYDDYAIGASYAVGKYTIGLDIIDTDLPDVNGGTFSGDATGVLSISTSF
ncbi:MAG: TorF family putative porin, partial [Limnobacter sp.]|nr:TorF family putative porin [Limnobacter sp.]